MEIKPVTRRFAQRRAALRSTLRLLAGAALVCAIGAAPGAVRAADSLPAEATAAEPAVAPRDPLGGHEFTVALVWSSIFFRTFPDEVKHPVNDIGSTVYQANDGGHFEPLLQYVSPAWEFLKFKDAQGSAVAGLSLLSAAAPFQARSTLGSQGPITGDYWLVTPFLFFRGGPLFSSGQDVYFRGGFGYGAASLRAEADYFSEVNQRRQHYRRTGWTWEPASIFLWELHWGNWVLTRRSTAISHSAGPTRFLFTDFSLGLGYRLNFGGDWGRP